MIQKVERRQDPHALTGSLPSAILPAAGGTPSNAVRKGGYVCMYRTRRVVAVTALVIVLGLVGIANPPQSQSAQPRLEPPGLRFVAMDVGGRYAQWVWEPNVMILKQGETVRVELTNQSREPHGFALPGLLKDPLVLDAGESRKVELEATEAGVFRFWCHLHGELHLGGQVLVVQP
jgi:plastocyanin